MKGASKTTFCFAYGQVTGIRRFFPLLKRFTSSSIFFLLDRGKCITIEAYPDEDKISHIIHSFAFCSAIPNRSPSDQNRSSSTFSEYIDRIVWSLNTWSAYSRVNSITEDSPKARSKSIWKLQFSKMQKLDRANPF